MVVQASSPSPSRSDSCETKPDPLTLEQAPRGLLDGFKAFVERDGIARTHLAGNHPKRHRLLDYPDGLPFTVHQDLMHLGPDSLFTSEARDSLVHPWHLEAPDRARTAGEAETALLLIRFLTVLLIAAGRAHPFVVLLVLSQLLDQDRKALITATCHTPKQRPARTVKPPGQLVLAATGVGQQVRDQATRSGGHSRRQGERHE